MATRSPPIRPPPARRTASRLGSPYVLELPRTTDFPPLRAPDAPAPSTDPCPGRRPLIERPRPANVRRADEATVGGHMVSPGKASPPKPAAGGACLLQIRSAPLLLFVAAVGIAGCAADAPAERRTPDALTPQGSGARIVFDEMVWHAAFGGAIFALVLGLLIAILWRKRHNTEVPEDAEARGVRWI